MHFEGPKNILKYFINGCYIKLILSLNQIIGVEKLRYDILIKNLSVKEPGENCSISVLGNYTINQSAYPNARGSALKVKKYVPSQNLFFNDIACDATVLQTKIHSHCYLILNKTTEFVKVLVGNITLINQFNVAHKKLKKYSSNEYLEQGKGCRAKIEVKTKLMNEKVNLELWK